MEFNIVDQLGEDLSDVDKAKVNDYPLINEWVNNISYKNQIAYLNANKINYIGYSYAKQTFRKILENTINEKYNIYSLCFKYDQEDYKKIFDGMIYALNQRELTTFVVGKPFRYPKLIGYLSTSDMRENKKEQNKKKTQKSVLNFILKKKEVFTNEIAKSLDLKLPYTNRILKALEKKKLIKRDKESSPSGGPIYMNKSIFSI